MLKFDEAFYGALRQTAAILALGAMWIFGKQLIEYSVMSLPSIGLFYELHDWTETCLVSAQARSP